MEHILTKEEMEAKKALSDVNIKVSDARNLLFKLQEEETEYLVSRETKALEKIQQVLENSQNLVAETHQNYEEIKQFCRKVNDFADFLSSSYTKLQELLELFKNKNELWEENIKKINTEISVSRQSVQYDSKRIKEREKRMDEETKSLKAQREHIESQQTTLAQSYKLEKELFNKITKK